MNTASLRSFSVFSWSLGLAFVAFDRFYLFSLWGENVKIAYLFFFLAGVACIWAEKIEFGARVTLYRLHDVAVSSPWHFSLLYFLWVNLFAPFSNHALKSVLYATAGWFSLVVVAMSAQLIFCERRERGISLMPARLKVAFFAYNVSLIVYASTFLLSHLMHNWGIPSFAQNTRDLAIFFVIGLPFLVWDFANPKRQIVSRWLVAPAVMGMVAMLFIMRDWPFLLGAIAAPIGLMAIGVYKKIRLGRALSYLAILCLLGINLVFIISKIPELGGAREIIGAPRVLMEEKISRRIPDIHSAIQSLRETNFMGTGVGAADIERGVWLQILAETGIAGLALHLAFFISLLLSLYSIRRAREVVVSNVAFLSVLIFLLILSHYPQNPYGAGLWAWYALWGVFASTYRKREFRVVRLDDFKRSKRA